MLVQRRKVGREEVEIRNKLRALGHHVQVKMELVLGGVEGGPVEAVVGQEVEDSQHTHHHLILIFNLELNQDLLPGLCQEFPVSQLVALTLKYLAITMTSGSGRSTSN